MRLKLTISYDGTAYAGWQIQPKDVTVQKLLQSAIRQITGEDVVIHGSGRTDRGVHARRQVAHCDLAWGKSLSRLSDGLNAVLSPDVRVLAVKRVPEEFHARFSAVGKEYRYFIWNDEVVPPFLRQYRTHVRKPLDITAMNRAAKYLVGRRDFASFTANAKRVVESTVRDLSELKVRRSGHEITIIAKANGFLYKMVRSLAGHLIQVGEGSVAPSHARTILSARSRTNRVPTAPPQGLFLWNVQY